MDRLHVNLLDASDSLSEWTEILYVYSIMIRTRSRGIRDYGLSIHGLMAVSQEILQVSAFNLCPCYREDTTHESRRLDSEVIS